MWGVDEPHTNLPQLVLSFLFSRLANPTATTRVVLKQCSVVPALTKTTFYFSTFYKINFKFNRDVALLILISMAVYIVVSKADQMFGWNLKRALSVIEVTCARYYVLYIVAVGATPSDVYRERGVRCNCVAIQEIYKVKKCLLCFVSCEIVTCGPCLFFVIFELIGPN